MYETLGKNKKIEHAFLINNSNKHYVTRGGNMRFLKRFILVAAVVAIVPWAIPGMAADIVIGFTGPISGPAAEYAQDIANGIDMAIKELNAAGGITVKGQKYTFKLEKLDDRMDPTQAVNNARRFKANNAIAVFDGLFNTIAPLMKINEEKGNEFLIMAYTSTPKATELRNKLLVCTTLDFNLYVDVFTDWALKKKLKKCAILSTLGAYGDEWRAAFRAAWEKKGGTITADKPANYYTQTDFSTQLTAVLATKPDCMFIGGPSSATALVIEQARIMGFKGAFILIDQAKQDYIAQILKGTKQMGNLIGTGGVASLPPVPGNNFDQRYTQTYKRMQTWECALNYTAMHALARAIVAAGTVDDVYKIRAAFPKAFPMLADKYPTEVFGITDEGRPLIMASVQTITNGKSDPSVLYVWWPKSQKEFGQMRKVSKTDKRVPMLWQKAAK
jgi:branched-chain amino acid transport system substrate-binding protein